MGKSEAWVGSHTRVQNNQAIRNHRYRLNLLQFTIGLVITIT